MAQKEISIVLRAKNAMAAGLKDAGDKINAFGEDVAKWGKRIGAAFLAVGGALVAAAYKAQEFNKQIGQIETLTDMSAGEIKKNVRSMSAEFGLAKDELTKGLYDALSAGVPKDNVFDFMRTAAKMAIGGAASTAEAVDLLTTAVNAFKIPAADADKLSDQLFTTVRLGKTTIAELGQSFSQVAPLAAASGVKIEEVLAATASLTKQGTPTAQAMTQIRAAIIAMNDKLGDGWSSTMTLQQGMQAMSDKAGGSATALKELTGRVEGTLGILALTGANAAGAAADLAEMTNSAGAATDAFGKMADKNPFDKLKQSANNMMLVLGDAALEVLAPLIIKAAEAAQKFSEKISAWVAGGGVKETIATLKIMLEGMKASFDNLIAAKIDIAVGLITAAVAALAIKIAILAKGSALLSMEMNTAAISAGIKAASLKVLGAAADGAAAKVALLKAAVVALQAAGIGLIAVGFAAIARSALQAAEAAGQLSDSMANLKGTEDQSKDKWGVGSRTLKLIREAESSGDVEALEKLNRLYPETMAKI